ncbi:enoyl-CoA hydratase/isomerase family protein [Ferrovibrio terrae]|uniref:3-hydroxyisobutyryl-CoA hydrolase n=1 Tax=Ferrovibrio terrae TaxID=2594003 RepID=A0A516H4S4_9PROT|nr:enoyl-CoA hydratase/isomerase family protein [Ferrovibrio terrae]QDO98769.1 enoyl-CoA hydratase/isomerase family protein [Ferrovibrio terrae]
MSNDILFSVQNGIGIIQLNRPQALNALTHDMCIPLEQHLRSWAKDAAVRAVIIKGSGEKAFCAGGDIRKLADRGPDGVQYRKSFWYDEYRCNTLIGEYPKPFIALIDGIFMGGGVGLSVHGSHRIISEFAHFAMPETGIGLFPDVGGTYFLPRCPGELGVYLGLTGARLKGADILTAGVATHFVPRASMAALEQGLIDAAPTDKAGIDAVVAKFATDPGPSQLAERKTEIDRRFGGESVAAVMAALEADPSPFSIEQAGIIRAKSPTSVKLTFAQLRRGRSLSLRDCMKLEWRICNHVAVGHDFYEGVRAVIIDKDHKPKWQPARLEDVTDAEIEAYFAPVSDGELLFD